MKYAKQRQQEALKDSWLEGEKSDALAFVDFGHLADIIVENWTYFEDIIPSQHWLKQRMDEMENVRNYIAHNRMLLPSEFQRMYMYIVRLHRADRQEWQEKDPSAHRLSVSGWMWLQHRSTRTLRPPAGPVPRGPAAAARGSGRRRRAGWGRGTGAPRRSICGLGEAKLRHELALIEVEVFGG